MNAAGVRFVGGSDAGIAPAKAHGRYPTSVIDLGRIIGAVPRLVASTSTAAQVCGLGDSKGRLRTGYDADLLVVAGDLASTSALLWQIRQVVLRGYFFTSVSLTLKPDGLCVPLPGVDDFTLSLSSATPLGLVSLPRRQPALLSAIVAFASDLPLTFGTTHGTTFQVYDAGDASTLP